MGRAGWHVRHPPQASLPTQKGHALGYRAVDQCHQNKRSEPAVPVAPPQCMRWSM